MTSADCCTAFTNFVGSASLRTKSKNKTEDELRAESEQNAKKAADADDALDAMVRKSIKLHGP